jgi:predicted esterase
MTDNRGMAETRTHAVVTPTHGRYLVDSPDGAGPRPVLLGFHGYGEHAGVMQAVLARLDPGNEWLRVAVQGLHRFYDRGANQVVASWMTREDREHAIDDNVAYALTVRDVVARDYAVKAQQVLVGFSQGVAQAYRSAMAYGAPCCGIIALGGDVPPDVAPAAAGLPPVLVGRGRGDTFYTGEMFAADVARLRAAGVDVTAHEFDGGHEWSDPFVTAAAAWLAARRQGRSSSRAGASHT